MGALIEGWYHSAGFSGLLEVPLQQSPKAFLRGRGTDGRLALVGRLPGEQVGTQRLASGLASISAGLPVSVELGRIDPVSPGWLP